MQNFCSDPLSQAKLNFVLAIALIFKPFLAEYQVDQPLVFFLARGLEAIVRKLLTRFLKCSVFSASSGPTGLYKINIEDVNNHSALEKVDIGNTNSKEVYGHCKRGMCI